MDIKKENICENLDINDRMEINLAKSDSVTKFGENIVKVESLGTSCDNLKNMISVEKIGDFSTFEENMGNLESLGTNGDILKNSEFGGFEKNMGIVESLGTSCDNLKNMISVEKANFLELGNGNFEKSNLVEKIGEKVKAEELDTSMDNCERLGDDGCNLKNNVSVEKTEDIGSLIEERVNLLELASVEMAAKTPCYGKENLGTLNDVISEKLESSDSSSSSESESENDSEDEEKEGEINDSDAEKMVEWSDDGISEGPIKSRNEHEDLPPVPPVEASLEPYHRTVPIGVISSIIGAQVIVEGVEQHNPLNEGTIFWITESRSPLGVVDEIFGPVKGPYYIIRYNSENELPEGIKEGTPISFVPEFAKNVLKEDLYKKGYDASGDNDEEISDDYEFSDDEKEAEYRKLQKIKKKRGTNEANYGNEFKERKNFKNPNGGSSQQNQFSHGGSVQNNVIFKNRGGFVHNNAPQRGPTQVAITQNQQPGTPAATSADNGNNPSPFVVGQHYGNSPMFVPQFQQTVPNQSFFPPPNVLWANGMPVQQGMVFPNGIMWPQQNLLPNGVPFPQQFAPNHNFSPNGALPGNQQNFSGVPSFGLRPGPSAQSGPNQQFGVAMPMNLNGHQNPPNGALPGNQQNFAGVPSFGSRPGSSAQCGPNQQFGVAMPMNLNGQQNPPTPGNTEMPREFNQGANQGFSRGRGTRHMGSGRFGGGRGRQ